MEKHLNELYRKIHYLLGNVPPEQADNEKNEDIFIEMANLYNALSKAGYDQALHEEEKTVKLYGVAIVNSAGYSDGTESAVRLYTDLKTCITRVYRVYKDTWMSLYEDGALDTSDGPAKPLDINKFAKEFVSNNYVLLQCYDSHIQFEFFTDEIKIMQESL